jgi:hypothetical protein
MLDNISLRFLRSDVRIYNKFFAARKNCPAVRRATAANLVFCGFDLYCKSNKSLKQKLRHYFNFCPFLCYLCIVLCSIYCVFLFILC